MLGLKISLRKRLTSHTENIIQLNLATLRLFSLGTIVGEHEEMNEEDLRVDEDYRYMLKVCVVVFHEMRHLYQKRAVQAYTINKRLGGRMAPQPESDETCELWLREMQGYVKVLIPIDTQCEPMGINAGTGQMK